MNPNLVTFVFQVEFCRNFGQKKFMLGWHPGMPARHRARHDKMNFRNFRQPPLYDCFLENSDLVEQKWWKISKSDHFWPLNGCLKLSRCADDVIRHIMATLGAAGAADLTDGFFVPVSSTSKKPSGGGRVKNHHFEPHYGKFRMVSTMSYMSLNWIYVLQCP